jgi:hypothetical protein
VGPPAGQSGAQQPKELAARLGMYQMICVLLCGCDERLPTALGQFGTFGGVNGAYFDGKFEKVVKANCQVSHDARCPGVLAAGNSIVSQLGAPVG